MKQMSYHIVGTVAFSCALSLFGNQDKPHHCEDPFVRRESHTIITSSGNEGPDLELFAKVFEDFYAPGGLADRLHLAKPYHQAIFTPSEQLAMLASLGRHPVPHWLDGAHLLNAIHSMGVMEFVTPGCPTCRSFYSDTTKAIQQISIIFHVFGHNNFSSRSMFARMRNADQISESFKLADLMGQLYQTENPDEVKQWYQYLSSLEYMQDMAGGSFEGPEKLGPGSAYNNEGKRLPHPRQPTLSVLQAIIANLPSTAPAWKLEMAQIYERMLRSRGYVPPTKIMNEGFATLMMEIIAGHSEYNTDEHLIEYMHLFTGVLGRGQAMFTNPYWLGLEAWRCLRRRFNLQPEIVGLSPIDRDAKFMDYANSLIESMTDHEFLRLALDEKFVHKHKLFLQRDALPIEFDHALPGRKEDENAQFVVASKDPREIIDYLVDQVADLRRHLPQIKLESFEHEGNASVRFRQVNFQNQPLEITSAAKTLLVKARILEKIVTLDALVAVTLVGPMKIPDGAPPWYADYYRNRSEKRTETIVARITVFPNGNVLVTRKSDDGKYETLPDTQGKAQEAINLYIDGEAGFNGSDLSESDRRRYEELATRIISDAVKPGLGILSHAPTAARAFHEYSSVAKTRMAGALKALREGKLKFRSTKGGIAIRLFPEIPKYNYDRKAMKKMQASGSIEIAALTTDHSFDKVLIDLGQGDHKKGDRIWGKKPQDGDDGEGEEDGEEGDEEGDEDGKKPDDGIGGKGGDPLEVIISFDMLNEIMQLELPNRKARQSGEMQTVDRERDGGVLRADGEILWDRMMPTILANGRLELIKQFKLRYPDLAIPANFDNRDMMREGLKLVTPEQHIVVEREVVKIPESKAVLVLIMDQSGSMHGVPQEIIKHFYHHLLKLLKKKYKDLEIIYIGFNESKALVMTKKQFFGNFLNGGDNYQLGWNKGIEVLSDPKYKNFDKYGMLAGDFQSYARQELHESMYTFVKMLNWGAAIQTIVAGDVAMPDLIAPVKELATTSEWFDYGQLTQGVESRLELLKGFFGKERNKK